MKDAVAAGTYVQISREDLEEWLRQTGWKWTRDASKAGIYFIHVGQSVAVKLSSTIGSKDDAMGRGEASMQLALVSTVTGQTLNKKAQGQSHFARTLNWKTNWKTGVERIESAYIKAQGFYDALALIKDRAKYKRDLLEKIQSVPGWSTDQFLADLHARVSDDGILTLKQEEGIDRALDRAKARSKPVSAPVSAPAARAGVDEAELERLRGLYRAAMKRGDTWAMDFLKSIAEQLKAGRALSEKQQAVVNRLQA